MKKRKSKPKLHEPEKASIDDDAVIVDVLAELQAGLKVLAARRAELPAGDFDADLCASTAAIAKAALTAVGERRQRAKGRRRELAEVPLDELIDFVRSLPEKKRDTVIAGITRSLAGMKDRPLF